MIESLMCDTCEIWRREATDKYGDKSADTYSLFAADVSCIFLDRIGKTIPNDGTGRDIILDGEFRMSVEPIITDKIKHSGYDYVINEIQEKSDLVTQKIQYYRATVIRQRKSNETPVTITL